MSEHFKRDSAVNSWTYIGLRLEKCGEAVEPACPSQGGRGTIEWCRWRPNGDEQRAERLRQVRVIIALSLHATPAAPWIS